MPVIVVHSNLSAWTTGGMPTVGAIEAAIAGAQMSTTDPSTARWGRWIGTASRITRPFRSGYAELDVARLYEFPDAAWYAAHGPYMVEQLTAQLTERLRALGADVSETTWETYSPAVNGPLSWWASDQAAQTPSRNEEPNRLSAPENPVGPSIAGVTTPETLPQQLRRWLPDWASPTTLLVIAGVAVGGYALWKYGPKRRAAKRVQNPREDWLRADEREREAYLSKVPKRTRAAAEIHGWDDPVPSSDRIVGLLVPGRGGGAVTALATPTQKAPKTARVWVGLPAQGLGHSLSRSAVRSRIRRRALGTETEHAADVAQSVAYQDRAEYPLPGPVGTSIPHVPGGSKCSPSHRMWGADYKRALSDAQLAAEQLAPAGAEVLELDQADEALPMPEFDFAANPPGSDPGDAVALATMQQHPRFAEWAGQTARCVAAERRRAAETKPKLGKASYARERAQFRASELARGVDLGSAEYRDEAWQRGTGTRATTPKTRKKRGSK